MRRGSGVSAGDARVCRFGVLFLVCALPTAGAETRTAPEARPVLYRGVELVVVPLPDFSDLEPEVRDQLTLIEAQVRALAANGEFKAVEMALAYGELGKRFATYDLFDTARSCFLNAIRLDSDDHRWPHYLGYLEEREGNLESAVEQFEQVLTLRPSYRPARVRLARIFLIQDRLLESEIHFKRALESPWPSPAATAGLGQIALARREYAKALEFFEVALSELPAADSLHYPMALAYRGLEDSGRAREHLERVGKVTVGVDDPLIDELTRLAVGANFYLLRGIRAFNAGHYPDAIEEFRKATNADVDNARALVNLGSALAKAGEIDDAIAEFDNALRIDPMSFMARSNLGILLTAKGRHAEALLHLERAVEIDPQDEETLTTLAEVQLRTGSLGEAERRFAEALRITATSERALVGHGGVRLKQGRFEEALRHLEAARQRLPQSSQLAYTLARLLAAAPDPLLRDGQRALRLAQAAYEATPAPLYAATVAMAFAELGRCEDALIWQKKAAVSAQSGKLDDLAAELWKRVSYYERGSPCRPGGVAAQ